MIRMKTPITVSMMKLYYPKHGILLHLRQQVWKMFLLAKNKRFITWKMMGKTVVVKMKTATQIQTIKQMTMQTTMQMMMKTMM